MIIIKHIGHALKLERDILRSIAPDRVYIVKQLYRVLKSDAFTSYEKMQSLNRLKLETVGGLRNGI